MSKHTETCGTRNQPFIFHSHDLAVGFVSHAIKPLWIVLGDNENDSPTWLVVMPADARRLERQGYEIL